MAMLRISAFGLLLLTLISGPTLGAETIRLTLPNTGIHYVFYRDLLKRALINAGHAVEIKTPNLPHARAIKMLAHDQVNIYNLVESAQRNAKFVPVEVGLTDGLIGHRVLLIPKGDAAVYKDVQTLDDFRKLGKMVAMGANWFDVKVWDLNGLEVYRHTSDANLLFGMLAARRRNIDYYSTGANEALAEMAEYGPLGIELEPRLMLIYDRDYRFYLSPKISDHYKTVIYAALKQASDSGLIRKMVREYWKSDFEALHFDDRVKINLKTPR